MAANKALYSVISKRRPAKRYIALHAIERYEPTLTLRYHSMF